MIIAAEAPKEKLIQRIRWDLGDLLVSGGSLDYSQFATLSSKETLVANLFKDHPILSYTKEFVLAAYFDMLMKVMG
jgi:hypothetical protein